MDTMLLSTPDTTEGNWDLTVDADGNWACAPTEAYAQAQDAASAIKTFQGECFYDTTIGIPYWTQVFGKRSPLALIKALFEQAALTVPGVVSAKVFLTGFVNRKFTGQVQIFNTNNQTETVAF